MKPTPLHVVRYFKGEDTSLISKHLHSESAFQVASRFIHNLKNKKNESSEENTLVSIMQVSGSDQKPTIFSLTSRAQGPLDEGVMIRIETQRDPNWDYPQYSDPCATDGGHVTTAGRHESTDEGE